VRDAFGISVSTISHIMVLNVTRHSIGSPPAVSTMRSSFITGKARSPATASGLMWSPIHPATLASLPQVDAERLGAIGFCFGGSVVLELVRDGADLKGVVSFHGVLTTRAPAVAGMVNASVLVCTGADDPLVPPEQVVAFEEEMRAAGARDWQVISYGNTLHGFTNPQQTAPSYRPPSIMRDRTAGRGRQCKASLMKCFAGPS
jgi:hypothetical protein